VFHRKSQLGVCKMKMCTNALRGVLSFAIRFPLGLRAQAGNFSRIQILDRTWFSLSIAAQDRLQPRIS
jgi:hypothetical protein